MTCPDRCLVGSNCCHANQQKATIEIPPDFPSTKIQKHLCQRKIQKQAFHEVLTLVATKREDSTQYRAIQKVLAKYKKFGFDFVTRQNLEYCMMLNLSGRQLIDERACPNKIATGVTAVSSLTSMSNEYTITNALKINWKMNVSRIH